MLVTTLSQSLNNENPTDSIIREIIAAAIQKDHQALAVIESKGHSLDVMNHHDISAAMILGEELNGEAIEFLWDKIANKIDFAKGLAYKGSELAQSYIDRLPVQQRTYNVVAIWAAKGGHLVVAETFLNKEPEANRNYIGVARAMVMTDQVTSAKKILKKAPKNNNLYFMLSCKAAGEGHQDLAELFVNRIPKKIRKYDKLANLAEKSGHQSVATYFKIKALSISKKVTCRSKPSLQATTPAAITPAFNAQIQRPSMEVIEEKLTQLESRTARLEAKYAALDADQAQIKEQLNQVVAAKALCRI